MKSRSLLRAFELEENENRKDFTAAERRRTFAASKQMVEDAERADAIISGAPPKKRTDPRGRKSKGSSRITRDFRAITCPRRAVRGDGRTVSVHEGLAPVRGAGCAKPWHRNPLRATMAARWVAPSGVCGPRPPTSAAAPQPM